MQLARIITDLAPKILMDVFKCHIKLSKAFEAKFDKKPWDGGQKDREWLASVMEKKPRVKNYSSVAVRNKPASEWDVTNLIAALSAVMEPSDVSCDMWCKKTTTKTKDRFDIDVSASARADCQSWKGFSINVTTGASFSKVVECVVTEAPSNTKVVAVCREETKDHDLPNNEKGDSTEVRPVHLPLPEVGAIVKVRESRNTLYHRSKTEVSGEEFTQLVKSVEDLIEQAVHPYVPKESDVYAAELKKAADSEFL